MLFSSFRKRSARFVAALLVALPAAIEGDVRPRYGEKCVEPTAYLPPTGTLHCEKDEARDLCEYDRGTPGKDCGPMWESVSEQRCVPTDNTVCVANDGTEPPYTIVVELYEFACDFGDDMETCVCTKDCEPTDEKDMEFTPSCILGP